MKKWKEAMKTKGIYIVSLFGTITILAVAAIAINLMEGTTKEGTEIDLNETPGIVAEQKENIDFVSEPMREETPLQEKIEEKNMESAKKEELLQETTDVDSLLQHSSSQTGAVEPDSLSENVTFSELPVDEENASSLAELGEQVGQVEQAEESMPEQTDSFAEMPETEQAEESQAVSGMNPETLIHNLSCVPEHGMAWPIQGNVVLNYSADHAVYHATLDSYRTSDGILIHGEEGMPVCAAVKGVVTEITEELKTGTTVTMRISEEYSIRYGQLADVTVKVGDVVEQGEQFAVVGKPSKYYTKEGFCLYIQVLKGETPINPMLYLREEQ